MMMPSIKAASTLSVALCFIVSLHHCVGAFSSHGTSVINRLPTSLTLAWFDDDGEDEAYDRKSSPRSRNGGRTASAERSKTRRYTDKSRNDWKESRPQRRQKIQQQPPPPTFARRENPSRFTAAIDCPHFGTCPGCVVNSTIADIDIIQSAKLYFSSLSVQKHILPSKLNRQSLFEEEDFFKVIIPSSLTGWRSQAKLAVAPTSTWSRASGATIGLYARSSHKVLSIPDCKVHHPSINRAVEMIAQATKTVRTPVYMEDNGIGLLRYIQLQVETSTGKVCLTLVMNAEKLKECQPHLSFLVKELKRMDKNKEVWHSIWCHCNDSRGNAIFARDTRRWHPVEGPPYICEKIPGSDPNVKEGMLYFSPKVFRQGNFEGFAEIAREVGEAIPRGSKVCEMYAGVGLLGLSSLLYHGKLAEKNGDGKGLRWLRCSDENPDNEKCFERAVNSMPMHITGKSFQKGDGDKRKGNNPQQNKEDNLISIQELVQKWSNDDSNDDVSDKKDQPSVTYKVANAAASLYGGQALGADVLIVDPPRKGLDEPLLKQLCLPLNQKQPFAETAEVLLTAMPKHLINWTNDVRTLIYVSCGFDALARECDQLISSNAGWKIESATGYVLFPGSNHVETVVVLRR
jgi:tRNA/tmRNA/rRNA uracil-C5-methylase (TrmA/RlmC/RlmD family)